MKIRVFALLLLATLFLPVAALAQNVSTTQMQLVTSPVFTGRLQYLMTQQAQVVLAEPQSVSGNPNANFNYTAACHSLRASYAAQVLSNPSAIAPTAAVLVSGANYSGAVVIGTVTGSGATADSSVTDGALTTVLQNDWNTLSKCVTN